MILFLQYYAKYIFFLNIENIALYFGIKSFSSDTFYNSGIRIFDARVINKITRRIRRLFILFLDTFPGSRGLGLRQFCRRPSLRLPGRHFILQPLWIRLPSDLQLQAWSLSIPLTPLIAPNGRCNDEFYSGFVSLSWYVQTKYF